MTRRDAEVPGSIVVRPEKKLDHSWPVFGGKTTPGEAEPAHVSDTGSPQILGVKSVLAKKAMDAPKGVLFVAFVEFPGSDLNADAVLSVEVSMFERHSHFCIQQSLVLASLTECRFHSSEYKANPLVQPALLIAQ